jgi:hypothetical protein
MHSRVSCFVIMPYNEHSDLVYTQAVVPVLQEFPDRRLLTLRADTMGRRAITLHAHVQNAVKTADFCIADLTGGNPNVMFEIGYAIAIAKPIILICDTSSGEIPANLRDHWVLKYRIDNLSEFRHLLTDACRPIVDMLDHIPADAHNQPPQPMVSVAQAIGEPLIQKLVGSIRREFIALVASPSSLVLPVLHALLATGKTGISIRVACQHPEGDLARLMAQGKGMSVATYRAGQWESIMQLNGLLRQFKGNHVELRFTELAFYSSLCLTDTLACYTPYLSGAGSERSPTVLISQDVNSNLYSIFKKEFHKLWETGEEMDIERSVGVATGRDKERRGPTTESNV